MSGGKKDDAQEKSLEPTPERLRKARDDGDVAKSTDVTAAASYLGLVLVLMLGAAGGAKVAGGALYGFLAAPEMFTQRMLGAGGSAHILDSLSKVIWAIAPIFLLPFVLTVLALFGQQAVVFAPSKIAMKLSRISIISNAKQKFGLTGLVEFAKSVVKLFAIATTMFFIVYYALDRYIAMPMLSGKGLPVLLHGEGTRLLLVTTVIVASIACLDYFWRVFDHKRNLRMSYQEIKEETKESEGDPHMKGARQRRAREIATNQMMLDVPKAEVIVVNPTHYSVALQWSRNSGAAPVCVAKGVDAIAARIREIAAEHDVPIFSDPPTARLIHATVEIGAEIEPDQYRAIAIAIRFAEDMRAKSSTSVGRHRPADPV